MNKSILFNFDYDTYYDPFMTDQHWYLAYALHKHFDNGTIIGIVDISNNNMVVTHCMYKIDDTYIDIRGMFSSFDEVLVAQTKVKQNTEYAYFTDHIGCVEEDVMNYLDMKHFVNSPSFDKGAYVCAKSVVNMMLLDYPYLKKFEK
jgi:hypothetical protein